MAAKGRPPAGEKLRSRLRSHLQARFGPTSEALLKFGFRPRWRRSPARRCPHLRSPIRSRAVAVDLPPCPGSRFQAGGALVH
jgi:hypothetical protein